MFSFSKKIKNPVFAIFFYNYAIFCFCQICTLSIPFFQKSEALWVSINVRAQDEYIEFLHWKWLSLRDMTQVPTASSVNGDKLKEDNFHSRLDSLTYNIFSDSFFPYHFQNFIPFRHHWGDILYTHTHFVTLEHSVTKATLFLSLIFTVSRKMSYAIYFHTRNWTTVAHLLLLLIHLNLECYFSA